jgi:hypothetical protein
MNVLTVFMILVTGPLPFSLPAQGCTLQFPKIFLENQYVLGKGRKQSGQTVCISLVIGS